MQTRGQQQQQHPQQQQQQQNSIISIRPKHNYASYNHLCCTRSSVFLFLSDFFTTDTLFPFPSLPPIQLHTSHHLLALFLPVAFLLCHFYCCASYSVFFSFLAFYLLPIVSAASCLFLVTSQRLMRRIRNIHCSSLSLCLPLSLPLRPSLLCL